MERIALASFGAVFLTLALFMVVLVMRKRVDRGLLHAAFGCCVIAAGCLLALAHL